MNWLDVVIIVAMVITTWVGLRIGIIKAVLFLGGVVGGVILAGHYYVYVAERLSFISQAGVAKIVAFAIILVGVIIVCGILASLLKRAASMVMLGWVDRIGGATFSLALGIVFWSALLATWVKFLGVSTAITESALATIFLDRFPLVLGLLPSEFDVIRSFFQ
jgi:membrane protein required for colicin V production